MKKRSLKVQTVVALPKPMMLVAEFPNNMGDVLTVNLVAFAANGDVVGYSIEDMGQPFFIAGADLDEIMNCFEPVNQLSKFNFQQALKHSKAEISKLKKGKQTEDTAGYIRHFQRFIKHANKWIKKAK